METQWHTVTWHCKRFTYFQYLNNEKTCAVNPEEGAIFSKTKMTTKMMNNPDTRLKVLRSINISLKLVILLIGHVRTQLCTIIVSLERVGLL